MEQHFCRKTTGALQRHVKFIKTCSYASVKTPIQTKMSLLSTLPCILFAMKYTV